MSIRLAVLALALTLAAGTAGCGLGAGASGGAARVLVTRDFGARQLDGRIVQDVPGSETVMRLLQRELPRDDALRRRLRAVDQRPCGRT